MGRDKVSTNISRPKNKTNDEISDQELNVQILAHSIIFTMEWL